MLTVLTTGQASKFLVAVFSAAASAITVYYGTAKWEPAAIAAIGAVLTYAIPNASPPADAQPPAQDGLGMLA
jgi:hypothetical protein